MRRMRILMVVLMVAVSGAASAKIVMPPPPPLPVGWEENIAPGFDPCIELTLENTQRSRRTEHTVTQMREQMDQWGSKAIPILIGFLEDPRWQSFHATIAGFLSAGGSGEAKKWANDHIGDLLAKSTWTLDDRTWLRLLGNAFWKSLDRENIEKAKTGFIQRASEPYYPEKEQNGIRELFDLLVRICPDELADLLESQAMEGPEHLQETCLNKLITLRSESAFMAALKLMDETQDANLRGRLAAFLSGTMGPVRAHEPMAHIVDREAE
jgi:hypothetical protein